MKQISCCGTDCDQCNFLGNLCQGCNESRGKVFHAPEGRACPIYECSVLRNGYPNCSTCEAVPCAIWKSTRDPSLSDEAFEAGIAARLETLRAES